MRLKPDLISKLGPRPKGRGYMISENKYFIDMSFIRIWVHLIWSTKNRQKIINSEFREALIDHIKSNCKEKGI